MLTDGEERYCYKITDKIAELHKYLSDNKLPNTKDIGDWYSFLSGIKSIQGNMNNDVSFISTLLAKDYLNKQFDIESYDAAEKPQGAPGLDIDLINKSCERIVAEIKTTVPYNGNDFGAQQKKMIMKDLTKLNDADAIHKFMFVTEDDTFNILCKTSYEDKIAGIKLVQLLTGREYTV